MGDEKDFNKISPTAILCAMFRANCTNIPYAKEVYGFAVKETGEPQLPVGRDELLKGETSLSVLEGRYLSINEGLDESTGPVLEISSGLSPRGLHYSQKRFYVETDLPEMARFKKKITDQIKPQIVQPLNVFDWEEFESFGKKYKEELKDPVNIVIEGLMMYFDLNEQMQIRDNIYQFLRTYSPKGCCLTTDFSSREVGGNNIGSVMGQIEEGTGRRFNRFIDNSQVYYFLEEGGLSGRVRTMGHLVDKLSCLDYLEVSKKEALSVSERYNLWKITLN